MKMLRAVYDANIGIYFCSDKFCDLNILRSCLNKIFQRDVYWQGWFSVVVILQKIKVK